MNWPTNPDDPDGPVTPPAGGRPDDAVPPLPPPPPPPPPPGHLSPTSPPPGQPPPSYVAPGSPPGYAAPGSLPPGSVPTGSPPGYPPPGHLPPTSPPSGQPSPGTMAPGSVAADYPQPGYPSLPGSAPPGSVPPGPAASHGYPPAAGFGGSQPRSGWQPAYSPAGPAFDPRMPPEAPRRVTVGGGRPVLIALVTVLALLAGGFAAVNIRAGGRTGAASPEAAAEQFFDAVANEDLIGVLEMLDPAERDVMVPFVRRLESELSRLALTEDMDLNDIPGVDLEVDGLEVSSTNLTPEMAEITVTGGTLSVATEPESVPIGEVLRDLIEANGGEVEIRATQDQVRLDEDAEAFLVATETDGRWHLSLFFTIAEYARRDADLALPNFDAGVTPQGAASPEEAVREFAEAAAALDVERMIALLPPDQMRALQVYAPLFLEDAEESIEEFRAEEGFAATVEDLEFETSDIDGGTRVVPTAGTVTVDSYEGATTASYGDGCLEVSGEGAADFEDEFGDTRVCPDDLADLDPDLSAEEEADLRELGALFSDVEAGVVVVERHGAFYVDPLGTFGDLWFQLLEGIEREDLEEGGILYRLFTGDLFGWNEYEEYDEYGYEDEYDYEDDYEDDWYD